MTKDLLIKPENVLSQGSIEFTSIPVNAYRRTIADELSRRSPQDLTDIWRDMCAIREFEHIINEIKIKGSYRDVTYQHAGPAHLSLGQEAAAVGMAFALGPDDHIFGSHRSHGEILAKAFAAIRRLDDDRLLHIMRSYRNGRVFAPVSRACDGPAAEQALRFVLYGAYCEIFARDTGFNRGLGGSMHAFFRPFGIYPNNAIVGGSGSIAPGAALFKRVNRRPGIVVANIGDASLSCGPVWEGITFASMDQYRTLWDQALGGGLPILFNVMDNFYGMGGQPDGETMGCRLIARIAAGVNPEELHAERVNGEDPLAVIDAIERKKEVLLEGRGPVLLDTVTYRTCGHSPSDASTYRSREELELWESADPISAYRERLAASGVLTGDELDAAGAEARERVYQMFRLAADLDASPRIGLDSELVSGLMFSGRRAEKLDDREPELTGDLAANPRVRQIAAKVRAAEVDGAAVPKMKTFNTRDAIFEALLHRFAADPTMIAFGEENRDWGGAFAVYRGLTEALPYHRLFNAPISEAAIVGAAVGYAMEGGRAVAELMYADFLGRAGDEVLNQLPKWQAMSAGELIMPVVLRVSVGDKYGAQHSQDFSSLVAHVPGLKVVFPVTPYDAKGLLNAALAGTDPVVFFESQRLYDMGERFEAGGVPEGYYEIEIGLPSVKRTGTDLTIITVGPALYTAMDAAVQLQELFGLSAEVVDLRSLNPLSYQPLAESVRKTGRVLLASEAVERGSFLQTVAATVSQLCFDDLDAPPVVVGARNWITPPAELEQMFFPQPGWLLDAIHEQLIPLPGYRPGTVRTAGELVRRARLGV